MFHKKCGAFAATLGVLALALIPNAASAGSPRGAFAAAGPLPAGSFRHFHRHGGGFTYWPGYFGDYGYAPPYGEAPAAAAPPASNDVHYTYTYDVPWDWAHRLPPMVAPSDHPYVPGCHNEAVTVPGRSGGEHVVNVTRCY